MSTHMACWYPSSYFTINQLLRESNVERFHNDIDHIWQNYPELSRSMFNAYYNYDSELIYIAGSLDKKYLTRKGKERLNITKDDHFVVFEGDTEPYIDLWNGYSPSLICPHCYKNQYKDPGYCEDIRVTRCKHCREVFQYSTTEFTDDFGERILLFRPHPYKPPKRKYIVNYHQGRGYWMVVDSTFGEFKVGGLTKRKAESIARQMNEEQRLHTNLSPF